MDDNSHDKGLSKLALPPMNYHSLSVCPHELLWSPKTPHELPFRYQRLLIVSQM
jgi:hypothetical protein